MDCLEVEKHIPFFLANKIEEKDIREFVEHMEACEECREELMIQFLASEGVTLIEEGESFNLEKELEDRLQASLKRYETKYFIRMALWMTEGIALLIIVAVLLYAFI